MIAHIDDDLHRELVESMGDDPDPDEVLERVCRLWKVLENPMEMIEDEPEVVVRNV